jgi:hypothetical protein
MKNVSLLLLGLIWACSNSPSSEATYENFEEILIADMADATGANTIQLQAEKDIEDLKIIKTATLRFPTDDLEKTRQRIRAAVGSYNGIIQNDRSGKGYNEWYREMVIRVPSKHFHTVLDSISNGVSYFDTHEVSQQDVSEEFVDLQARLKAKRQLEARYLELLRMAKNVSEVLDIERELSKIREEIEVREGRLQYLQDRVSYSTINLYFYKTSVETGVTVSYGSKMWNAIQSGWSGLSYFFLGLLHIWPFFVILILIFLFIKRYFSKKNKKTTSQS